MSLIIRFDQPIKTESHLKKAIAYIMKEHKAKGRTFSNSGITPEQIIDTFYLTKEMNPSHGEREGYHLKFSFSKDETISHDAALEFVKEWAEEYLGEDYDYVVAEHSDRELTHMHLVFNSVKRTGGKYHYDNREWKKMITPLTNRLCKKYGTGMLKEKDKKLDYSNPENWRGQVEKDMEECILHSHSYGDFKKRLQKEFHYALREGVSRIHGTYLALTPPGKARAIRTYQLKPGHMPAEIEAAIRERMQEQDQKGQALYQTGMQKELSCVMYRRKGSWAMIRQKKISYKDMSPYQKYFARRVYQARHLYRRTNTPLKMHEQSVRAINRMMDELALTCKYNIRSERDLSGAIFQLAKQEAFEKAAVKHHPDPDREQKQKEYHKDLTGLKKIRSSQKEMERKVKQHDQRTKQ